MRLVFNIVFACPTWIYFTLHQGCAIYSYVASPLAWPAACRDLPCGNAVVSPHKDAAAEWWSLLTCQVSIILQQQQGWDSQVPVTQQATPLQLIQNKSVNKMAAGSKMQNEVKKRTALWLQHKGKRKMFAIFNTSKCVLCMCPSLWKFERAICQLFPETLGSTGYAHCMLSLSGHFHLTYPTPSLEAFPSWFSNSWNLLPVIRQVCLDHMAESQSCLEHVQGCMEPVGPSPDPSEGTGDLWIALPNPEQPCPVLKSPLYMKNHLRFRECCDEHKP